MDMTRIRFAYFSNARLGHHVGTLSCAYRTVMLDGIEYCDYSYRFCAEAVVVIDGGLDGLGMRVESLDTFNRERGRTLALSHLNKGRFTSFPTGGEHRLADMIRADLVERGIQRTVTDVAVTDVGETSTSPARRGTYPVRVSTYSARLRIYDSIGDLWMSFAPPAMKRLRNPTGHRHARSVTA